PALRAPLTETFAWLRGRFTELLTEAGRANPGQTAATVVATLQGGYVLARAGGDPAAFTDAVEGLIALLED
ncbi:MAG: TetR/AcrR family transcriptional regulator, partial [Actinomycetota bacterium]|nr:TetR/AcrR family transcriptional regulator [Actinomycetota bacterium]